ncbi:HAD family hydrolase [Microbacterium sp. 4R-513]|uniref:HAD family hydrolase n=1 Tax=Microbacterium sp. 4R-513 TaxID=2567934 RepID=UPI0013E161EF|nr:HAD family hydrolase [Microbacterium sp. 4R-513]QIG40250.1 HAD family hydrolase [Microbacterium sp. 4R-513]
MSIRGVCFDLDGTLLRDDKMGQVVTDVAAEVAARHPELDAAEVSAANLEAWRLYWPELAEQWFTGEVDEDAVAREVWRRTLAGFDVDDRETVDHALALHTAGEQASFELYPESREVLAALRERGIRIAIITNGPTGLQRAKVDAVGLGDLVDAVIVSGEHGVEKPEAEIFEIALGMLGLGADEALHIGDNQVADVEGARRAGLRAVWINRVEAVQDCEPDAVVTELRGLLDLL